MNKEIIKCWVYVVRSCNNIKGGSVGPIKVGYTKVGVERRIEQLKSSSPYPFNVIKVFDFDCESEAKEFERYLLREFRKFNIKGEWFESNAPVKNLASIRRSFKEMKKNEKTYS